MTPGDVFRRITSGVAGNLDIAYTLKVLLNLWTSHVRYNIPTLILRKEIFVATYLAKALLQGKLRVIA